MGVGAFQPVGVPVEAVERIATNLVKNAAEATPWVGAISIHVEGVVERPGDDEAADTSDVTRRRVVMSVRDRGCGMDQASVRQLMAGGISTAGGRGLGFRVVRELVAMSGGCPECEEPAGGRDERLGGVVCDKAIGSRAAARESQA